MSKKVQITMPEYLTVEMYQKFGSLDHLSNTERIIRVVSAVSGESEDFVNTWNVSSLFKIYKDLNNSITSIEPAFLPIFEWEGETWGFQPLHKMSSGEYIDLEKRLEEGILSLHKVMAILYRPIKSHKLDSLEWKVKSNYKWVVGKAENLFKYYDLEEYDIEKRNWREERFKKLPINLGLGAYNFFLFVGLSFSKDLKTSFQNLYKQMKMGEVKEMEALLATINGFTPYTT